MAALWIEFIVRSAMKSLAARIGLPAPGAVMPANAGNFLAVGGTTLSLCAMPRRQKMPAFAGMTAYWRA
jgi:hypothetical protein